MPKLSVTVIALNEEENIIPCLETVKWADEIVVVDTGSTDKTVELARRYTDRIFSIPWPGYGAAKNFASDQAAHEWIFSLDADERVPEALQEEILAVLRSDAPLAGYRVPRKNYFGSRWIRHAGWHPDLCLRLFQRARGRFWEREVHEEVLVQGEVGVLKTPLEHYSYKDVSEYVARLDRYAKLAARELAKAGRRPGFLDIIWRPAATFVNRYFIQWGLLEGRLGYTLAVLSSMYTFLKYYYLRELTDGEKHEH